jgi:4-amino-4-deoxy-L-arabinose transferase-like glycosyltransferase
MVRGILRGAARLARATGPFPRFLVALIAAALLIRIAAALILHFVVFSSSGSFFTRGDEVAYDLTAWQQAQVWRGDRPEVDPGLRYLLNAFTYTGAAVYYLVGHHVFAVILLNCLFSALAAGLVAASAYRLFGLVAAYVSGIAVAIFPTTILLAALNMKDPLFLLLVALFIWLTIRLTQSRNYRLLLALLPLLALIGNLRLYILGLLLPLVPLALLLAARDTTRRWAFALAALAVGTLLFVAGGGPALVAEQLPRLNQQRHVLSSTANSGYVPPPPPTSEPTSPADEARTLARWLPTGILYALAAPFPWAASRPVERMAIPEMLLWYLLLALALLGLVHRRRRWHDYLFLLGYIAGVLLIFAIFQGNYGVLMRQRSSMLAPFVAIFSGAGASYLWEQWLRRRGRTAEAGTAPGPETPPTGHVAREQPG